MGAEISLEVQGRRTRGQQWDTYQVPGPAWGTDWDIETRKTESLCSGGTSLCVCGCVHVKCEVWCTSVVCVWCENSGDLVVCSVIIEC